jgi:hypothetical protein
MSTEHAVPPSGVVGLALARSPADPTSVGILVIFSIERTAL